MSEDKKFKMRFDPNTIRHLGIKMYSQIPRALAELIANAYDADATEVRVNLYDEGANGGKRIVVEDNGMGMAEEEINEKFLVIGRNRREGVAENITPKERTPSGKKGLGKLALFGIGNEIRIETKSAGKKAVGFVMNWRDIQSQRKAVYNPVLKTPRIIKGGHGTVVTVSDLAQTSAFPSQKSLAESLSRLFDYPRETYPSEGMKIYVSVNGEPPTLITQDLFLEGIIPEVKMDKFSPFVYDGKEWPITGKVITGKNPVPPSARGVALYANGRMVSSPAFFAKSDSSHFYSYVTGYFVVDFVDEGHGDKDRISTDRQSLRWDEPQMGELQKALSKIMRKVENEWRETRRKKNEKTAIRIIGAKVWADLRQDIKGKILAHIGKTPETDRVRLSKFIKSMLPPKSDKKILISHASRDKGKANIIYRDLIRRGVDPKHILYTSGDEASRVSVRRPLEHIRNFFAQHVWENPHVIFVVSENMEKSWYAVLEAGAAWVTQTEHTLAKMDGYHAKEPLISGLGDRCIVFDNKKCNRYKDPSEARRVLDYVVDQYNQRTQPKPKKGK